MLELRDPSSRIELDRTQRTDRLHRDRDARVAADEPVDPALDLTGEDLLS